jgi:hypothetical protein
MRTNLLVSLRASFSPERNTTDGVESDHFMKSIELAPTPLALPGGLRDDRLDRAVERRAKYLFAAVGLRQPVAFTAERRQHAKVHRVAAGTERIGHLA